MKKSLLILLVCLPLFLSAQTTITFNASQTFVTPAGITALSVEAWGAGGAGGSSSNPGLNGARGGAGGGGGAFASTTLTVTSGASLSVVVGVGGKGVASANGGFGGFSAITSYAIRADGGKGGNLNSGNTPAGGLGGTVAASTGTVRTAGSPGGPGSSGFSDDGELISSGDGGNAANGGGTGGVGIIGVFVSNVGNNGNPPGGGGSGGRSSLLIGARRGGDGADGRVRITYNCPVYTVESTTASAVNVCSGTSSEVTLTGDLPVGLYSVSYNIQGIAQTPAPMNVTTAGTGSFIASGFTAVGTKFIVITALTSGSSAVASENCTSPISQYNSASVVVNSSGTAPEALPVTGETCTQITANWEAVPGALYYEFDLSTDSAFGSFVTGYSSRNVGNVLSLTITGLTTTTYYYRVRAHNSTCASSNSNTITYENPATPSAATGLGSSNISCTQFTVTWNSVPTATSYKVEWYTAGFASLVGTATNISTNSYTITTGLTRNTPYRFRIYAINRCGTSPAASNGANVTTSNTVPGTVTTPTFNYATNIRCTFFTANWNGMSNASSYLLTVTGPSGNVLPYVNYDVGNVTSFQVLGLNSNTNYSYTVRAINSCGNATNASNARNVTTLNAVPITPTTVTVVDNTTALLCNGFTVSWTANTLATDYTVQMSTDINFPVSPITQEITGITTNSYTFTGLQPATNYYYKVLARNGCGSSAFSTTALVKTRAIPDIPTIVPINTSICQIDGQTLAINGGPLANTTYVWSTGETGNTIFVTSAGSYTVQAVSPGGCSSAMSAPATVAIDLLPTATAGAPVTLCPNRTLTIGGATASNGTINWTVSGGGTLNSAGIINPVYTPSPGGAARTVILTLTVTSNNTCSPQIATAKQTINIQGAPTASISGSQSTCATGSITLAAGEANATNGTVSWTHDGAGTITNGTTLTPTYTAAAADAGKQITLTMTVTASPACATPYRVTDVYPVIVLANNNAEAPSSSPTLCINTAMTDITHETITATGIGTPLNLPAGVSASWASNTITISGIPTEAGTFAYSIPLTGGCGTASATGTIVVNINTAGPPSSSPTTCVHASMADITHTTTGATGIGTPLNLPAGVSVNWTGNSITISGTPTNTGTFNYSIPLTGGCGNVNAIGTIIVNPLPATPVTGTIIQPTCVVPTGSIELNGLLASPTWEIEQTGPVVQTYSASGLTYTIQNLVPGIYTFTIHEGLNCPSPPTLSVEIKAPVINTWDGSGWSTGSAPIISDIIEFTENYQSVGDLRGCSCIVSGGKEVTIKQGHTLLIENGVTVAAAAGTKLIFENNASLVQVNDVVNTGEITYMRNTAPVRRYDFTYWSSPVTRTPAFKLFDLSPATLWDKYYKYDPVKGWVIIHNGAAAMEAGIGYIIRAPQNHDLNVASVYNGTFSGVPNNGTITVPLIAAERSSLLGNPYPSAVYADLFILDNSPNLYGTLYFWTHNSPPSRLVPGDATYNYTLDDYAVYNLTGSVDVGHLTGSGATTPGYQLAPLGYIAAGQSFFVKSKTNQNAIFTNSMRVSGDNAQFFKSINNKKKIEGHKVWINLTNNEGAFKQLLIGYVDGATNSWDNNYDGLTIDGNKYVDFYSINENQKLIVQGRGLPFDETDLVPLGYKSSIAGEFMISIDHTNGDLDTHAIYLEDKAINSIHNLRNSNYTFTTSVGTFDDRFVLRYTDKTLGTDDFKDIDEAILVSVKDKVIKISSNEESIRDVSIFDVSGKLLYSKKKIGSKDLQIANLQSGNQVMLIKISLQNDVTSTIKIIL